ncbi:MAG TPA: hypothetical protein PKX47_02485, partial [Smithellaceae bacterium]|nr:hypothetical protein [Smithellaceae bacterium]HPI51081.1 hypothetical protein [Smithellaceae bacterium]
MPAYSGMTNVAKYLQRGHQRRISYLVAKIFLTSYKASFTLHAHKQEVFTNYQFINPKEGEFYDRKGIR